MTEWHLLERSLVQNKLQLEHYVKSRNRELSETVDKYQREIQRREEVENELRFHEWIVSASCDAHAYTDTSLVYQNVNESFEDLVGLPRKKIIGRHMAEVLGRELFQTVVSPRVTQALAGRSASHEQWRHCPVKGERCLHVSYTPCREERDIVGIAATIRDRTDMKRMEGLLAECEKRCRQLEGTRAGREVAL